MTSEKLQKAREYEEKYSAFISPDDRPMFHFSPRIGWMNDPNGFSFYGGQYHLFYQYHPYSLKWGPMHWGHAVSKDLIHWEYLPAALAPDTDYDFAGCFSGSAITLPDGRQMLVYTGVREVLKDDGTLRSYQTQCLAIGDGVDYEKVKTNPVIGEKMLPKDFSRHDFRDPKIFQKKDGTYGLVVANRSDDKSGAILLYESENGLEWHFAAVLDRSYNLYGRMWECPDFFALNGSQVLMVSPQDMSQLGLEFHNGNCTMMLIGDYDEETHRFTRSLVQPVDYGIDFYAPQTMETEDGRRVMIAWMQNWDTCVPYIRNTKWCGQMIFPRELTMQNGRILQTPVREIEKIRGRRIAYENVMVTEEVSLTGIYGRTLDMTVKVRPQSLDNFESFRVKFAMGSQHYSELTFNPRTSSIRISRAHSGFNRDFVHERECFVRNRNGQITLRILLDRYSAEIFVNGGEQVMTMTFYTPLTANGISFGTQGNTPVLMDVEKYELKV